MLLLPNNVVGKQPSRLAIITLNQGKGCSWGEKVGLLNGPRGQETGSHELNKVKQT